MSVANIGRLQEPFRRRKMVSARFRRHSRGLRNNFATPSYLHRAAKLASTLRFPASFSRHKSGIVRRRNITLFKKATKSLRNKRVISQHFAKCFLQLGVIGLRSPDGMLLLFLDRASADRVMREVHAGVCGPHMGGHMLARKIMRTGYFWLTMETDYCQFVQRCPECQIHGDPIHVPPSELHALTSPWPFSVWGIDIIGKISPKSSSGHEFILVAIDYFTKWVEAASYARLTSSGVASFIRSHIICRYGVPYELISDRGVHFRAEVDTLVQRYSIRHHRSSTYRPQTNGAVEAANKNIKRILRRMVETSRDWSEKLPFALWAYRTSFHTSTGATPYSLVYGMEAMLPVEIEMGSLRVSLEQQIPETDWAQARFDQLNLLDERRLRAAYHVRAYQRKMARSFKKRVRPRPLRIGDLVLKVVRGLIRDPRGKFRPNWSGPYFIRELTPESAAWLMDLDGNRFSEPTNVDQLKSFLSFLSPYHLDLRYVPCLKTTLRPWDQMSSSAASTWTDEIYGSSLMSPDFQPVVHPMPYWGIFPFWVRFTDLRGGHVLDDRPIVHPMPYWGIFPFRMRFTDLHGGHSFYFLGLVFRVSFLVWLPKRLFSQHSSRLHAEKTGNPVFLNLVPLLVGNVGLISTKGDLKEVDKEVAKYKVGAPARAGLVSHIDVIVPPGNTGLDLAHTRASIKPISPTFSQPLHQAPGGVADDRATCSTDHQRQREEIHGNAGSGSAHARHGDASHLRFRRRCLK
uniref:Integrase catalytic domain-containing protein n=1 Tax=Vitis vinifera TaxID=29760 RepID=A5C7V3_VITVI|nr:hypothetical protein VITISV_011975 [Vitis vinifera]